MVSSALFAYVIGCALVALVARKQKGGFWAYLVGSFFLTPLIGLIVLAVFEVIELVNEKKSK